jgi:hypothetical protein
MGPDRDEPFDQGIEHVRSDFAGKDEPRDKSNLAIVVERNQDLIETLDRAVLNLSKRVRPVSRQENRAIDANPDEMKKVAAEEAIAHDNSSTMVQMISSQNNRIKSILNAVNNITEGLEI